MHKTFMAQSVSTELHVHHDMPHEFQWSEFWHLRLENHALWWILVVHNGLTLCKCRHVFGVGMVTQ